MITGLWIGDRSHESAQKLWDSLANIYKKSSKIYTDFWEAYKVAFPPEQLSHCGKHEGETNYAERFNNTLRQRVSRLVRKTLSFSKKLINHVGAIWDFVHYYNREIYQKLSYPCSQNVL